MIWMATYIWVLSNGAKGHSAAVRAEVLDARAVTRPRVVVVWTAGHYRRAIGQVINQSGATLQGLRLSVEVRKPAYSARFRIGFRTETVAGSSGLGAQRPRAHLAPGASEVFELPVPITHLPSELKITDSQGRKVPYSERIPGL
jgi:hypothetical protein